MNKIAVEFVRVILVRIIENLAMILRIIARRIAHAYSME
jgi:hypothetical protein